MEHLQQEQHITDSLQEYDKVTVQDLTTGAIALLFEYPDIELDEAVTIDKNGLSCI